ncbi:MAG: hypothetical protein IKC88_00860, partial [Opitutales bacterium]|nr:hypothetical protein [Opitutales bacterium]
MNENIKSLKKFIVDDKLHHQYRITSKEAGLDGFAEAFKAQNLSAQERAGKMQKAFLNAEKPVILPNENIVFTRTIKDIP